MNRSQRRASGNRCHDCRGRSVVVQADYGWLCDPCWLRRQQRIEKAVLAGVTAIRPIDRDRPAPRCITKPQPLAAECGRDAVTVIQFARGGCIVDSPACEQHMGQAVDAATAAEADK